MSFRAVDVVAERKHPFNIFLFVFLIRCRVAIACDLTQPIIAPQVTTIRWHSMQQQQRWW